MAKKEFIDTGINSRFLAVLQEVMVKEGVVSELAMVEAMGFQPSLLRAVKNHERTISGEHILVMASFGVNPMWLKTGTGPVWSKDFDVFNLATIPFASDYSQLRNPENISEFIYTNRDKLDCIAVRHYGHAMRPSLLENDLICMKEVEQQDWHLANSGIYGVLFINTFTIKRIKSNDLILKGYLVLHSDNEQNGGSLIVPSDQIVRLFHVTHVIERNVT